MPSYFLLGAKNTFSLLSNMLLSNFIFPATIWNIYDEIGFLPLDTHKLVRLHKIASGLVELSSTENVNKRQIQPAVGEQQL